MAGRRLPFAIPVRTATQNGDRGVVFLVLSSSLSLSLSYQWRNYLFTFFLDFSWQQLGNSFPFVVFRVMTICHVCRYIEPLHFNKTERELKFISIFFFSSFSLAVSWLWQHDKTWHSIYRRLWPSHSSELVNSLAIAKKEEDNPDLYSTTAVVTGCEPHPTSLNKGKITTTKMLMISRHSYTRTVCEARKTLIRF